MQYSEEYVQYSEEYSEEYVNDGAVVAAKCSIQKSMFGKIIKDYDEFPKYNLLNAMLCSSEVHKSRDSKKDQSKCDGDDKTTTETTLTTMATATRRRQTLCQQRLRQC